MQDQETAELTRKAIQIVRRYAGDEAEDLVQGALARLVTKTGVRDPLAWVLRVAQRDWQRLQKNKTEALPADDKLEDLSCPAEQAGISIEALREVQRLNLLPHSYQEAVGVYLAPALHRDLALKIEDKEKQREALGSPCCRFAKFADVARTLKGFEAERAATVRCAAERDGWEHWEDEAQERPTPSPDVCRKRIMFAGKVGEILLELRRAKGARRQALSRRFRHAIARVCPDFDLGQRMVLREADILPDGHMGSIAQLVLLLRCDRRFLDAACRLAEAQNWHVGTLGAVLCDHVRERNNGHLPRVARSGKPGARSAPPGELIADIVALTLPRGFRMGARNARDRWSRLRQKIKKVPPAERETAYLAIKAKT